MTYPDPAAEPGPVAARDRLARLGRNAGRVRHLPRRGRQKGRDEHDGGEADPGFEDVIRAIEDRR